MFRHYRCLIASLFLISLLLAPAASSQQQSYPGLIGVGISDGSEGARNRMFVDLGKVFRPDGVPLGAGGITADAQILFFDIRPVPAWAPPIDDPAAFQPDWSGTYHLAFTGQADVSSAGDPVTIPNKTYDATSNITIADVIVPSGTGVLILKFSNTKRTAASAANSGFTNL